MKNKSVALLILVFVLFSNISSGTIIIASNPIGNMILGNHPPIRIIGMTSSHQKTG